MAHYLTSLRSLRLLPSISTSKRLLPFARGAANTTSTTTYKTADPAVHSDPPQGEGGIGITPEEEEQYKHQHEHEKNNSRAGGEQPFRRAHPMPTSPPKLESDTVSPPTDPNFQQKRWFSLSDVSCVGVDGTPLRGGLEQRGGGGGGRSQEEENREYFKDHKASPLSNIEFADTRKPVRRATDGEKGDGIWGGEGTGYMVEDTVDESLARAEAIFQAAREAGDPDSPQARALAMKLRERHQTGEAAAA